MSNSNTLYNHNRMPREHRDKESSQNNSSFYLQWADARPGQTWMAVRDASMLNGEKMRPELIPCYLLFNQHNGSERNAVKNRIILIFRLSKRPELNPMNEVAAMLSNTPSLSSLSTRCLPEGRERAWSPPRSVDLIYCINWANARKRVNISKRWMGIDVVLDTKKIFQFVWTPSW